MRSEWLRVSEAERNKIEPFLGEAPVKIAGMARALGLEVKSATLRAGISGQLQKSHASGSGYRIRVNRHEAPTRQRFTIAHEIAHYLLHRAEIGDGIEDSVLYRSTLSNSREAEANRLAADLVMPSRLVALEFNKLGLPKGVLAAERLAETFNVSEAAMQIRLGIE